MISFLDLDMRSLLLLGLRLEHLSYYIFLSGCEMFLILFSSFVIFFFVFWTLFFLRFWKETVLDHFSMDGLLWNK